MSNIKQLPQHIIAQIAAGEVIERPASVVKELVENALDAGANNIKIIIEKAGFRKISVLDDGQGMNAEDLLVCALPHTTSKIVCEDDLCRILSFGFRGEALSTIAAVSAVIIRSRQPQAPIGHGIKIINREIIESQPVGMPIGTQVIVESLFEHIPARKKFFTTPANEFYHIVNLLTRLALDAPAVGFSLWHNNKLVLQLPTKQSRIERVRLLLGERTSNHLLAVSHTLPHLTITGFIGTPQISSRSKNKQYLYVNNRHVKNLPISLAVKEAFGNLLDPKSHPAFYLSLSVPPESLDVNIHPRKEEVKFLNISSVTEALQQAIKQLLEKEDLTFHFASEKEGTAYLSSDDGNAVVRDRSQLQFDMEPHTASVLREATDVWSVKEKSANEEILQLHNTYLIAETPKGALIIDQHAAHERILYEQFLESFHKQKKVTPLPKSVIVELTPAESAYLEQHLEIFRAIGFELELFGNHSFKLSAIPEIFKERDIPALLSEVLDELMQGKNNLSLDRYTERTIAFLSCRSAIKAGDYLTPEERQRLLEKLKTTTSHYTCPHGRPVQIEMSSDDLHRLFRRK